MYFKQVPCEGDRNFGYIIADESSKKCALIDPSPEPALVLQDVKDKGFQILYIINTYSHYDHSVANSEITDVSEAQVVCHSNSSEGDIKVNDGDTLTVGDLTLKILYTPGHTQDSICVLDNGHLITGDTLFVGMIGGRPGQKKKLVFSVNLLNV